MANKQGKIWGSTELIIKNCSLEFHRIEFKKGFECSVHKHEYKTNAFFVESGKMLIRVWKNNYELIDETVLGPGDYTAVAPNEFHQFVGLEDGIAFELYWANMPDEDIVRKNVGGKTTEKEELKQKLFKFTGDQNQDQIWS